HWQPHPLRHRRCHFSLGASSCHQRAARQISGDSEACPRRSCNSIRAKIAMAILGGPILETPRAVIFDIGRVIIRVDLARSFEVFGKRDGLSAGQVWTALQTDTRWDDWQEGRMTPREWHKHLSEKFQLSLT